MVLLLETKNFLDNLLCKSAGFFFQLKHYLIILLYKTDLLSSKYPKKFSCLLNYFNKKINSFWLMRIVANYIFNLIQHVIIEE